MPLRILCPSCQTALMMPEDLFGKAVRCPNCQQPFQCPTGPAPPPVSAPPPLPPGPPASKARARRGPPPSPVAASSGNPFDFGSAPAETGDDWEDGPAMISAGRRGTGWDRVQGGAVFLYLSAGCFFLCYLLFFFVTADSGKPRDPASAASTIKTFTTLLCLVFMAGTVLGCIGQTSCVSVPHQSGAKPAAIGAAISMLLCSFVGAIVSLLLLMSVYGNPPSIEVNTLILLVLFVVGALTASFIFFLFFLTIAALHFKQAGLVGAIMGFAVVFTVSPLVMVGMTVIRMRMFPETILREKPDETLRYLQLLGLAGLSVWFCLLVGSLCGGINRAHSRRR